MDQKVKLVAQKKMERDAETAEYKASGKVDIWAGISRSCRRMLS